MGKIVLMTRMLKQLRRLGDTSGAAALEFAIVGPVFILFMIGTVYTCMMLFAESSMQYAVEAGARCASIQTTVCTSSSTTTTYAQNAYYGPLISPTFTYATPACGHQVNSTVTFGYNFGYLNLSVPLTATACYP
jgi:Flp pilus assembly protein TadG